MPAHIISDLHLGSRYCRYAALQKWLAELPEGNQLVLNGDVVHAAVAGFRDEHMALLENLKQMALTRSVVWVAGNHDRECRLAEPGAIEFKQSHTIGKNLIVVHGHEFETRNFFTGLCFTICRKLYRLHLRLGGPPMPVTRYARNFPVLFRIFRNGISANAARFAKKRGFNAIACGHTHYAEDTTIQGIRYINTGAWTDPPFYSLFVDDEIMELTRHERL